MSLCSSPQAADRPGGAPHSGSGEGEPGAEAEGRDQRSQAGGPASEGAARGHRERAEPPEVRRRRARSGTSREMKVIYTEFVGQRDAETLTV